jgi:hypothetical protein
MSDTRNPKTTDRPSGDVPDAEAIAALDAEIRSLRDEPVATASLMRMRAGLDARIEAAAAAEARRPTPIALRMRGRFGAGLLAAALAAAAAFFLLILPALESLRPGPPQPQQVVDRDAPPAPQQVVDRDAPPAPQQVVDRDAPPAPQQVVDRDAPPAPQQVVDDVDAVSDEALAIAFELELLSDYDVIAQLDLLELLDDREPADSVESPALEGRI